VAPGHYLFTHMNCNGDESSLFECQYEYKRQIRAFSGRVLSLEKEPHGVYCLDNSTLTTELRGGSGDHEGNVYLNNLPVCHDWWSDTDAAVVCRMLGFQFGVPTTKSRFGRIPNNEHIFNYVHCRGREDTIFSCDYEGGKCPDGVDGGAGVICHGGHQDNGSKSLDVELRGGPDESEGVVYVNDRPVCADVVPFSFFWSMENALVTCRMFGFQFGYMTSESNFSTPVTAEQFGYKVKCTGSEMSLDECEVYATARCRSTLAAGVRCSNPVIELRGGTTLSGILYIDDMHVCENIWSFNGNKNARVACHMLGYSGGKAVVDYAGSRFGLVNGTSLPIHFQCNGSEKSLYDCKWLYPVKCYAEHGAGVECFD